MWQTGDAEVLHMVAAKQLADWLGMHGLKLDVEYTLTQRTNSMQTVWPKQR